MTCFNRLMNFSGLKSVGFFTGCVSSVIFRSCLIAIDLEMVLNPYEYVFNNLFLMALIKTDLCGDISIFAFGDCATSSDCLLRLSSSHSCAIFSMFVPTFSVGTFLHWYGCHT